MLLHSAELCASLLPVGASNHALPNGHVRSLQSPPVQPSAHVHLYWGEPEHTPWPLHAVSPGHAVITVVAEPQSPRLPGPPAPSDVW